jgi:negative regulator of flagellin synthesis FlgM
MKIQPSVNVRSDATNATGADRTASSKPAPASSAAPEDTVRISTLSAQVPPSGAAVVFDQAKVDAIRQAIAEGRFDVDATVVADRLIESALALGGRRSS